MSLPLRTTACPQPRPPRTSPRGIAAIACSPIRISSIRRVLIGASILLVNPAFGERRIEASGNPPLGRHQIRAFYATQPPRWRGLEVHGLSVREWILPWNRWIDRTAQGDYLLMAYHAPGTFVIWTPKHAQYSGNSERPWLHSWLHCSGKVFTQRLEAAAIPLNQRISGFRPGTVRARSLRPLPRASRRDRSRQGRWRFDVLQILLSRGSSHGDRRTRVARRSRHGCSSLKRHLEDNFPE